MMFLWILIIHFTLDDAVDSTDIKAKCEDGVLQVSLPLLQEAKASKQEITIN